MALQMSYEDQYGEIHAAAYVMITRITGMNPPGKGLDGLSLPKSVMFEVSVFTTKKSRDDFKAVLSMQAFIVIEADPLNPVVKVNAPSYPDCYTWLKTQPGFETATDV